MSSIYKNGEKIKISSNTMILNNDIDLKDYENHKELNIIIPDSVKEDINIHLPKKDNEYDYCINNLSKFDVYLYFHDHEWLLKSLDNIELQKIGENWVEVSNFEENEYHMSFEEFKKRY